jgi:hypothetical protein
MDSAAGSSNQQERANNPAKTAEWFMYVYKVMILGSARLSDVFFSAMTPDDDLSSTFLSVASAGSAVLQIVSPQLVG